MRRSRDGSEWRPRDDGADLQDPRKAAILTDPEHDESLGHLGHDQIMMILNIGRFVVEYTDSLDEAWERMPNMMKFLDDANALSASLFGKGRDQLVEVLAHDDTRRPAPEYLVERPARQQPDGGGEKRGL